MWFGMGGSQTTVMMIMGDDIHDPVLYDDSDPDDDYYRRMLD